MITTMGLTLGYLVGRKMLEPGDKKRVETNIGKAAAWSLQNSSLYLLTRSNLASFGQHLLFSVKRSGQKS